MPCLEVGKGWQHPIHPPAMHGKAFCGNRTHKQTYGIVSQDMPQAGEPQKLKGRAGRAFHLVVEVEDISKNQDIDMFLLALLSSFWSSYSGPPMKVLPERPSNFLFHRPLAMFLEPSKGALPQAWKAEVCRQLHLLSIFCYPSKK